MDSEVAVMMHTALDSEIGVELAVSDVETFKRLFYKVRRDARATGFMEFDRLTLKTCPTDPTNKIWIVRSDHGETEEGCSEGNALHQQPRSGHAD